MIKAFLIAVVTFFVAMFCLSMFLPFPLPFFLAIICAALMYREAKTKVT